MSTRDVALAAVARFEHEQRASAARITDAVVRERALATIARRAADARDALVAMALAPVTHSREMAR